MKLWTFQTLEVAVKLSNGEIHLPTRAHILRDNDIENDHSVVWLADVYEWGRVQAESLTGKKWDCLPVFCWTEKPDVRKFKNGVKKTNSENMP